MANQYANMQVAIKPMVKMLTKYISNAKIQIAIDSRKTILVGGVSPIFDIASLWDSKRATLACRMVSHKGLRWVFIRRRTK